MAGGGSTTRSGRGAGVVEGRCPRQVGAAWNQGGASGSTKRRMSTRRFRARPAALSLGST